MTIKEIQDYIEKNYDQPEILAMRKKWGLEREVTFDDARKYIHEHASDSAVAEYRLQLSKVNEVSLKQELAATYIKANGNNPFDRATLNLTRQGQLYKTDRLLFDALKGVAK